MRTTRNHSHQVAAAITLIALLAPLAPLMAWHCGGDMDSGHDCADHTPGRCAGLWSAACCDFASPPRPTDGTPADLDADFAGVSTAIVALNAAVDELVPVPFLLDRLLEDRAGPPPPRLLTSILLI